jgi:hypothetical protein
MKYTVVTSAVADHQLIEIWLNAPDRQRAASAFNRIEYLLKHDAHLLGREHPGGWRALFLPPFAVTFRVSEEDRMVTILSVYYKP